jgi:phosphinothricin acetyltransferase
MQIRPAKRGDAAGMLDIYAPIVRHSAITFEYDVPSVVDFSTRIENVMQLYPWLVAESEGRIAGYAYAGKFRERAAYQWCCESSVYIHPDFQRQGLALKLYDALFALLKEQGIINVYAVITLPNPESVALHTRIGFAETGTLHKAGFKLGAWHDVLLMEKMLGPHPEMPENLKPYF